MQPSSFDTTFAALTAAGRPFPWLGSLFKRFIAMESGLLNHDALWIFGEVQLLGVDLAKPALRRLAV